MLQTKVTLCQKYVINQVKPEGQESLTCRAERGGVTLETQHISFNGTLFWWIETFICAKTNQQSGPVCFSQKKKSTSTGLSQQHSRVSAKHWWVHLIIFTYIILKKYNKQTILRQNFSSTQTRCFMVFICRVKGEIFHIFTVINHKITTICHQRLRKYVKFRCFLCSDSNILCSVSPLKFLFQARIFFVSLFHVD